jgi:hypothetical protein
MVVCRFCHALHPAVHALWGNKLNQSGAPEEVRSIALGGLAVRGACSASHLGCHIPLGLA